MNLYFLIYIHFLKRQAKQKKASEFIILLYKGEEESEYEQFSSAKITGKCNQKGRLLNKIEKPV